MIALVMGELKKADIIRKPTEIDIDLSNRGINYG